MTSDPELKSVHAWLSAPSDRVAAIHQNVAAALGEGWQVVSTDAVETARAHWREWTALDLAQHYAALATPGAAVGPGLRHERSGVVFRLIPGGELAMGLGEEEERILLSPEALAADGSGELAVLRQQLGWMRPVRAVQMKPFLLAATPLVGEHLPAG